MKTVRKAPAKSGTKTAGRTGGAKVVASKPKRPAKPVAQKAVKPAASAVKLPKLKVTVTTRPKIAEPAPVLKDDKSVLTRVLESLDDDKAENIVTIDMQGRSSLTDAIVIATGRSSRHVASIAEHLARRLKDAGYGNRPMDGVTQGDWALVDAGDVIVHVFRPEVRDYYNLEAMWSVQEPDHNRTF